ncbi:hypothetical protein AJ87_02815 [Rhizobium yanglingense]|nr:hypothetical protein AJ87_02815 [Rhizobium yanglingense]
METWFAVKTVPGAQRSPSLTEGDQRLLRDSVVERNLRNEGFEVFMPSYRIEVRHHRNKRWIEKRFPTFIGYAFVNLPRMNFKDVEDVDGVGKLLRVRRPDRDYPEPFAFAQETIDRLRFIEWEQEEAFLLAREQRIRGEESTGTVLHVRPSAQTPVAAGSETFNTPSSEGPCREACSHRHPGLTFRIRYRSC